MPVDRNRRTVGSSASRFAAFGKLIASVLNGYFDQRAEPNEPKDSSEAERQECFCTACDKNVAYMTFFCCELISTLQNRIVVLKIMNMCSVT